MRAIVFSKVISTSVDVVLQKLRPLLKFQVVMVAVFHVLVLKDKISQAKRLLRELIT